MHMLYSVMSATAQSCPDMTGMSGRDFRQACPVMWHSCSVVWDCNDAYAGLAHSCPFAYNHVLPNEICVNFNISYGICALTCDCLVPSNDIRVQAYKKLYETLVHLYAYHMLTLMYTM